MWGGISSRRLGEKYAFGWCLGFVFCFFAAFGLHFAQLSLAGFHGLVLNYMVVRVNKNVGLVIVE